MDWNFLLKHGGRGRRAGAFAERLFLFEQLENGVGDLFFVHGDDFVDVFLDQRKRDGARGANRDAVRNGVLRRQGNRRAVLERRLHRRQLRGLHADDPDLWIGFLDGAGDARNQSSTAHGDDESVEISLCCYSISRPRLPCPAMTASSSKGWMKVRPSSSQRRSASSQASS